RVPRRTGTRQIVSGAGAKTVHAKSAGRARARYENFTDRGFMVVEATAAELRLDVYAVAADRPARLDYSASFPNPGA
ncbi:MAG: phosphoesterase, partial [Gordonia sp. (in: high G+C Gram-positive bacteria)]